MASDRVQSELAMIRTALLDWLDLTNSAIDAKIDEEGLFRYQNSVAESHLTVTHSLMTLSHIEEDHDAPPARQTPTLRIVAR